MKLPSIFRLFIDEPNINKSFESEPKPEKSDSGFKPKKKKIRGLSSKKALDILEKEGENRLILQKKVSAARIFAGQFKDFLVLILLVAMLISAFMSEILEAISISIILFLSAVMGFIQEYKTEKTLEALENMVSPLAKVFRDGKLCKIPANFLVRGDEILVEAGDNVPADAVLLESRRLEADESILTGESDLVFKEAEKNSLLYMGTSILKGYGRARVVKTGMKTQMGKIAGMLGNSENSQTPLQKKLDQMGKFIILGCLVVSIVVILAGILRGEDPFNMIITGLSVAVASVPEGLPAIVTIALALAVKRMVRRKALVRKLHAVETLGCANVICTDKTGTITQNKMTVKKIITADCEFKIEGNGSSLNGFFVRSGERVKISAIPSLQRLLEICVVCNDSRIVFKNGSESFAKAGSFRALGDPTETSLLIAAAKGGLYREDLKEKYIVYDQIPFDSSRKCMTVFVQDRSGRKFAFLKGAYDVILGRCGAYEGEHGLAPFLKVRPIFDRKNEELAGSGMRVLAFAYKEILDYQSDENLTFLGLVAMQDPPRQEAKSAVMTCKYAGIKTVLITGDHKLTAISIAKQVGIFQKGDMSVEGKELDKMSDSALKEIVKKTTVFARVSPKHKLRIVKMFKNSGNVVAMTGDGVNDAPAIKEADIGVSMGKGGSDVSKQAADLILLDDNFATLVAAVEEGRIIYGNIRKFMRYLLSCNMGEVLTTLFAMLIGMPVPLLPMQILLINLVTDGLPAIALGLEPGDDDIMKKPPRDPNESIFSGGLMLTIIVRGLLIAFTTLTVFTIIWKMTYSLETARTSIFLTLVFLQLIHVFECKSETKSIFQINHLKNKKLILASLVSISFAICAVWIQPLNLIARNCPLNSGQTIIVLILTLAVPLINALIVGYKDKSEYIKELKMNQKVKKMS